MHRYFAEKNVSSFCKRKSYSHFFSKNISKFAICNGQSFNDTLTNDIVSFEQFGPDLNVTEHVEAPIERYILSTQTLSQVATK